MATVADQVRVLLDKEDVLVEVLSVKDPAEIADKLFKKCIISEKKQYDSLDHERLDKELLIKYLLRLVGKKLKGDDTVWGKFNDLLTSMGSSFKTVRKCLEDELNKYYASGDSEPHAAAESDEADIILTIEASDELTELLADIASKWESLAIALRVPISERGKLSNEKNVMVCLNKILTSWLNGNTTKSTTLSTLVKAVGGPLVGNHILGEKLEDNFRPVKKAKLSLKVSTGSFSNLTIVNQSGDTTVADGKSTLLLAQASLRKNVAYQWKKNDQELANSIIYGGVKSDILFINNARQGTGGEYTCHVTSEGKNKCSNKIMLTVQYSPEKKKLLDLYLGSSEVPPDNWPPSGTRTFINLALVQSSTEPTDSTNYSVRGLTDRRIAKREKKESIKYEHIFQDYKSDGLILIEGRPGSGKTTLLNKLMKDWAKGTVLGNARWAMLITLRNLIGREAESVHDIFPYFCQNKEFIRTVERENGEGLCLVIDGLDEYRPQKKSSSYIYQLLYKTILPKAMVIVSSRPIAIKDLKWDKISSRMEILDFTKEQVYEYVDHFPFVNESYSIKLKEFLQTNWSILDMCCLPVYAAMICYLFKCKTGNISGTQTKVYEEFTCCIILRHLKRQNSEAQLKSLQDLPENAKKNFEELCHLAYRMTINSEQIVIPEEIGVQLSDETTPGDSKGLGLVTVSPTAKLSGFQSTYSFLHLTLQEFLAAYYISSLSIADQIRIIEEQSSLKLSTMWNFYCGWVDFNEGQERFNKLLCNKFEVKELLQFAFESQQQVVCDEVVMHTHGKFDLTRSPPERTFLSYVISNSSKSISKLNCSEASWVYGAASELEFLLDHKHNLQKLKELEAPLIRDECELKDLVTFLRSSQNLERLSLLFYEDETLFDKLETHSYEEKPRANMDKTLADNEFIVTLKSLSCLQELNLNFCLDFGRTSMVDVFHGLILPFPNIELKLFFLFISRSCVLELAEVLQQLGSNRVRMLAIDSGIIDDVASILANSLRFIPKVDELVLKAVKLDDNGMVALCGGIAALPFLSALDLSNNSIGDDGAQSIANLMIKLKNLMKLNLSGMNIGPKTAEFLFVGIQHCVNLKYLDLSRNKIDSKCAIHLVSQIRHWKHLRELDLSCNDINSDAVKALTVESQHFKDLHNLDLRIDPTTALLNE